MIVAMASLAERISVVCFAASYGSALGLEIWHWFRPRPVLRYLAGGFGLAGLLAQLLYLNVQHVPLNSPSGSLQFLAFILAIFYLYGSLHHRGFEWGIFVLPIILGLLLLAFLSPAPDEPSNGGPIWTQIFVRNDFWPILHGGLLLLAAVGVSVGFIASLMYFAQLYRLRNKITPQPGTKILSLERLESMNRRAILWAFPLLTVGLIVGVLLQVQRGQFEGPKIWSTFGLWVAFLVLLTLRYVHVRGQMVALWTIIAFGLLVLSLLYSHGGLS